MLEIRIIINVGWNNVKHLVGYKYRWLSHIAAVWLCLVAVEVMVDHQVHQHQWQCYYVHCQHWDLSPPRVGFEVGTWNVLEIWVINPQWWLTLHQLHVLTVPAFLQIDIQWVGGDTWGVFLLDMECSCVVIGWVSMYMWLATDYAVMWLFGVGAHTPYSICPPPKKTMSLLPQKKSKEKQ